MLKVEHYERITEKDSVSIERISKIKRLIAGLRSYDGETRRKARNELVFIGKPSVDFLIPMLQDSDDDVRWEAVKALSEIADPRAASDLVSLLMDHNFGVRWLAAEALISIGRESVKPLLKGLTEHPESSWLRRGALHALHDLTKKNPDLKEITGPVITALEGFAPEIGCLEAAYTALAKLRASTNRMKERMAV
jgi:HEAT repeat protein